jgi:regulatory protein
MTRAYNTRRVHIPARLWHNHGAVRQERRNKPRPPLDDAALERLALFYVGRYATTRAKLASYLRGKIDERGWQDQSRPDVERLVGHFVALGYINDAAFAEARAASLPRRGYGGRRVHQALRAAGIDQADAEGATGQIDAGAWAAALRFAERKRIGPFAAAAADRQAREKAFAAMMRAGHPVDLARRVVNARPGEIPEPDMW